MGYELNIKRESENNLITKEEWLDYLKSDPEFEQVNEFSVELDNGQVLTVPTPNAGLWKSKNSEVPFTFSEKYGEITVKNPDNWIIEKMISIAKNFNGIVEGEEGEKYDENYLSDPFTNPLENNSNKRKKWWEFWK